MSAGVFLLRRYESSILGRRMLVRVQPETTAFQLDGGGLNTGPPGAANLRLFVNVGLSRQGLGVRPRALVVRWAAGVVPPAGYSVNGRYTIPILRPAIWDAAIPDVSTGLYLGRAVAVIGKKPESAL